MINQFGGKPKLTIKMLLLILVASILGLVACSRENQTAKKLAQDTADTAKNLDANLTFKNVILEQADDKGRLWWKVKANQAEYSKDQKNAQIYNPDGELFQDGKVVYKIKATTGEVQQDGQKILLRGDIIATAIQDGAVLKGKELEWRPKEDKLIVRNNLTGTHAKLDAKAAEAHVFSRARRMELFGQVVAVAKDPPLQMRGEHLIWEMAKEIVISDKPIQIDRYKDANNITDRALGKTGQVNLKAKIATLKDNAQITLLEPPIQAFSNSLVWNLDGKKLVSDTPVQVIHRQQPMTVSGNKGWMDLEKKVFYLTGNVIGTETKRQAKMTADRMTWLLPTQEVAADGNVIYQQADPPLNLNGPKAFGKLQDQTIVITGDTGGSVITNIIP